MPPAKRDPASILDAILERVPRMRSLGVLSFATGDMSLTLTADAPLLDLRGTVVEKKRDEDEKPDDDETDPLNDRATYGGGRVPGFTRPKKDPRD